MFFFIPSLDGFYSNCLLLFLLHIPLLQLKIFLWLSRKSKEAFLEIVLRTTVLWALIYSKMLTYGLFMQMIALLPIKSWFMFFLRSSQASLYVLVIYFSLDNSMNSWQKNKRDFKNHKNLKAPISKVFQYNVQYTSVVYESTIVAYHIIMMYISVTRMLRKM